MGARAQGGDALASAGREITAGPRPREAEPGGWPCGDRDTVPGGRDALGLSTGMPRGHKRGPQHLGVRRVWGAQGWLQPGRGTQRVRGYTALFSAKKNKLLPSSTPPQPSDPEHGTTRRTGSLGPPQAVAMAQERFQPRRIHPQGPSPAMGWGAQGGRGGQCRAAPRTSRSSRGVQGRA